MSLDSVFHALGDATQRQKLRELANGGQTVGQLTDLPEISLTAASTYLEALEGAGWHMHLDILVVRTTGASAPSFRSS